MEETEKRPVTMENFEELYRNIKEGVLKVWDEEKEHRHLILLISKDGAIYTYWFDQFLGEAAKMVGRDMEAAKTMVFRFLGDMAVKHRAVGFIEVFESWSVLIGFNGSEEQAQRTIALRKKVEGVSEIKDLEGREENLNILARFRDKVLSSKWAISRNGDQVELGAEQDMKTIAIGNLSKISNIAKAIDKVLQEGE
jgi:hypothetical protein